MAKTKKTFREQSSAAVQKKRIREIKERIRQATPRQVVLAVKIEDGFATCVCGNKIKLELDGPILKHGKREFLPTLSASFVTHAIEKLGSTMSE
jgi:hypothetical protein